MHIQMKEVILIELPTLVKLPRDSKSQVIFIEHACLNWRRNVYQIYLRQEKQGSWRGQELQNQVEVGGAVS